MSTSRKDTAILFLALVASGKVREAFDQYISPHFRHHNAFFRGDRQSLLSAMEDNAKKNPGKILEVKRVLEDGDLVAVHSHVRQNPHERGATVIHIFRFEDNQVVELWDVGQPIPADSPNESGVF